MKPTHEPNEGVELLYVRGCPYWEETLQNLAAAMTAAGSEGEVHVVPMDTLEQAETYGFFASPTVHVDGVDADPHARRTGKRGLGMGRPYFWQGEVYAAPPVAMITAALKELRP